MLQISHRINTLDQLKSLPDNLGVEVDIHAYGKRLVVHHDAFSDAINFEEWLSVYRQAFVIFNIKEEGIEQRVCDLAEKHNIQNFFLLDLTFPSLMKMVEKGESRTAIRVSQYESVNSALKLAGKIDWIWLDLFRNELPITKLEYQSLRSTEFRICLVSPELHGRQVESISEIQSQLEEKEILVDAVCTKHHRLWS